LGRALTHRFYFNSKTKNCEAFNYGGVGGNENNFKTIEECNAKCKVSSQVETTTVVTAPSTEKRALPEKCSQPAASGMCLAYFERFYFDTTTNECTDFVYGGCQGNENNFYSKIECEQQCQPEKVCSLPAVEGDCYARLTNYFFNSETNKCETFTYHGCNGNANNFVTEQECQQVCQPEALTAQSKPTENESITIVVEETTSICSLPAVEGDCYARLTNYFFNSETKKCETFIYHGCNGNANNFESEEECQQKCQPEALATQTVQTTEAPFNVNDCQLDPVTGFGRAYMEHFFYNSTSGNCEIFVYGGMGGINFKNYNQIKL
jgi:papilin